MNTSPSLSPPGSDLDGLVERRLERFIEGETARTIYKLPKSGRLDPQRADVKAVLSTLLSERALRERVEGELESLRSSRDHAPGTCSELEVREPYPVDVLLDALSDAERGAEDAARQNVINSKARAFCLGKANGMREAWELAVRHRTVPVIGATPTSAKPVEREGSRDELLDRLSQLEAELKRRDEALRPARQLVGIMLASPFWKATVDPIRAAVQKIHDELTAALQPQEGGDA